MMDQARNMDVNSLMQKLRRLATLDTSVFDEVRTDTGSTVPAIVVVVGSMLLFGLGGWIWYILQDYSTKSGEFFFKSAIFGSIIAVVLWGVWVAVTYVMLTQVFRARADVNELIRVMGFAAAPLALGILLFIPQLDYGIGLLSVALCFGLSQIAIQTATDAAAGRVLVANGAGFAVWAIVLELFITSGSPYAPGVFIFAPVY